jgi:predicted TIM-barrel fold metal-dependent hydrolase
MPRLSRDHLNRLSPPLDEFGMTGSADDSLTRRRLLGRLGAIGGGLVAGVLPRTLAAAPVPKGLIDIHHHVAPTNWLSSGGTPDEARVFKGWSIAKTLELMDQAGVDTSFASLTVPGHRFDDPASARHVARECNEYMATLRDEHRGRFGLFALVPMPSVEDSLAEIAYAYDTLKADGIGFYTSYGDKHLGNTEFDPVFAELNRRNAVAFVHPSLGPCCGALQPQLTTAMIEYGTDTTRAIAEYIFNGGTRKFPNVKMIWSHAGGTMQYLVQRFIGSGGKKLQANLPNGFLAEAKKCYYDTAQIPSKGTMLALRTIVPISQILYGTDYPYKDFVWTEQMLVDGGVFNDRELEGVYHGNAAALLAQGDRPVRA